MSKTLYDRIMKHPRPWKMDNPQRPGLITDANGDYVLEPPLEVGRIIVDAVNNLQCDCHND